MEGMAEPAAPPRRYGFANLENMADDMVDRLQDIFDLSGAKCSLRHHSARWYDGGSRDGAAREGVGGIPERDSRRLWSAVDRHGCLS